MASIIVKNAASGQGKAMTALYEANKNALYTLACQLLQNEAQAAETVTKAFREIWHDLKNAKVSTVEQFSDFALLAVELQCRKLILQKNPKALRVPHSKKFQLPDNLLIKHNREDELSYLLTNLPMLQRYIFVMHQHFTPEQLSQLLQLDAALIRDAMDTEEENFRKLQAASKNFDSSYSEISAMVTRPLTLPESANTACLDTIGAISAAAEVTLKKQQTARIIWIAAIVVCVALITVVTILCTGKDDNAATFTSTTSTSGDSTEADTGEDTIPENSAPALDESLTYYADIDIADQGKITVKLDQHSAPKTSANFVNLAQNGFYDGLTFHRIMEGFMMQGGCPYGNGYGSADEYVVGEFSSNGYENPLSHTRGAISMGRSDDPNSASCQFFIVHEDSDFLDGNYACFGYVTEGMDIVDAICTAAEPTDDNGTIPASAQPVINSITIRTES